MTDLDELAAIARLRALVPSGAELAGAERRLAAEIVAARRGRPPGRGMRAGRRQRLMAIAAIAAAGIVAGVIQVWPSWGVPTAVRPGPTTSTGWHRHPGGPVAALHPGLARTEAELVDYATRAAAAALPFHPGPYEWTYWKEIYAAWRGNNPSAVIGPPFKRVMRQEWRRVDGRRIASIQGGRLVFGGTGGVPAGWPTASYRYLDSLPTNPAKLEAIIQANNRTPLVSAGPGDAGVFTAVQALFENVYLPPPLRAGLYGVLARLHSVHFDRSVTDLAARRGVGLYMVMHGYLRIELIVNPRTYAYMGQDWVIVKARTVVGTDITEHYKRGQVIAVTAVARSGIVRHAGQVP